MEISPEFVQSFGASFRISMLLALVALALPLMNPWAQGLKFKLNKPWTRLKWAGFGIILLGFVAGLTYDYYGRTLPDPAKVSAIGPVSTKILDRNGVLLYEVHGETKRTPVPLERISPHLLKATVAIEDKDFYSHPGISIPAIVRAAYENHKAQEISQGGSTITQQLVKLTLLTNEKSYERKIQEAFLAFKVEHLYSKDKILELYVNRVPYGRNTYGIEAASLAYFGKSAHELSLAESAYLASLPKAPSLYSPSGDTPQELEYRKNYVLSAMLEHGQISLAEHDKAVNETVAFTNSKTGLAAPHFVKWVEGALLQQYGRDYLENEGLEVRTSLDFRLQKIAERVVIEGANTNSIKNNAHNAALVAVEPKSGHILAMVGGKNFFGESEPAGCRTGIDCVFDPQTNVAISPRQPGSSFKPYTYTTAFSPQFSYSPASRILDRSQNFSQNATPYRPANYNNREYGLISMRQALAGSLNIAAVRTLSQIGVPSVAQTAKKMGINTPMESCGLSLTLGACEVKLVEHVAAFSVLANMGQKANVSPIVEIVDKRGRLLYRHRPDLIQVLDPQAAYEVVDIMSDNRARSFIFGSRSPLTLTDRVVAAKTGTSQDFKDGWTIGFTPQLAAGVWVGNNDGRLMRFGADGVVVAAPIWNEFMKEALNEIPAEEFNIPAGIQRVRVSARTGLLATQYTPDAVYEVFADYAVPKRRDSFRPEPKPVFEYPDIGGSNEPIPPSAALPTSRRLNPEL